MVRFRLTATLVLLSWAFGSRVLCGADAVDFDRQIRPLLTDACFRCHGPDEKTREADLRLDTRAGLFEENNGVVAFSPGNPVNSAALRRITSDDPDERMPPPDSGMELTDAERYLLRRWVAEGAAYVARSRPRSRLHLWVYEGNDPACRFYERLGAMLTARHEEAAPDGGTVHALRYAWDEPAELARVAAAGAARRA